MSKKRKAAIPRPRPEARRTGVASATDATGARPTIVSGDCSVAVVNGGATFARPEDLDDI